MQFDKNESNIFSQISLPDIFISEYLPLLNSESIKIYLYILFASKHQIDISPLDLSKRIGIDINSVKTSFLKLEELELITKMPNGYIINDIQTIEINKIYTPKLTSCLEDANENNEKNKNRLRVISAINNSYFQGVMSPTWYTDIDMMFTKYNFSEEVLISLFKYCFDRGKLTKGYVKAVANGWNSNKIKSLEDLEAYYINYEKCNEIKKNIAKKLGLTRQLTQYESAYVEKWINDFKYDINIIELALKKTTAKSNPSFDYIDKILTDWNDKSLRTIEDIKKYLQDSNNKNKFVKNNSNTKNKLANTINQRTYDDVNKFYDNLN